MQSEDWDRAYGSCDLTWDVDPHPYVEQELGTLPAGRAVELGCGEGRQAVWLASRGWHVTAVDFSAVAVDRGRKVAERHGVAGGVDWLVADVREAELPAPVDLALVLYLHLPSAELAPVLRRAAGTLADGGTLFVLGWDRSNAEAGRGPRPADVQYAVDELAAAVPDLRVERAEAVPQPGSADAADALFRAVRTTVPRR